TDGLGWIPGEVRRLRPTPEDNRIPHVGWNEVHWVSDTPLAANLGDGRDLYFVHSYHFCPEDPAHVMCRTPYAGGFVSGVRWGSIFGVQFHPEKSQKAGFRVLQNFLTV